MSRNPIRHTKEGWFFGSRGPFPTRDKALEVMRAMYTGGYKGRNPTLVMPIISKRRNITMTRTKTDEEILQSAIKKFIDSFSKRLVVPRTPQKGLYSSSFDNITEKDREEAYESVDKYSKEEINPTMVVPITSEKQLSHLFRAESQLSQAGVTFDTGTQLVKPIERHWELDWSLKGGYMKNPKRQITSSMIKRVKKIKRNPSTQFIGNMIGGLGILSIPLFIGLIIWANNKYGK